MLFEKLKKLGEQRLAPPPPQKKKRGGKFKWTRQVVKWTSGQVDKGRRTGSRTDSTVSRIRDSGLGRAFAVSRLGEARWGLGFVSFVFVRRATITSHEARRGRKEGSRGGRGESSRDGEGSDRKQMRAMRVVR